MGITDFENYLKVLERNGFSSDDGSYFKKKGLISGGHLPRWDVLTVSKNDEKYVIKSVDESDVRLVSALFTEYEKTNMVHDCVRDNPQIFLDGKIMDILEGNIFVDGGFVFLYYPLKSEIDSSFSGLLDQSVKSYAALHSVNAKNCSLPVLTLQDIISGSEEIYGGYETTFCNYSDLGLIDKKICKQILEIATSERDFFDSNRCIVHADPKIGEHILIDELRLYHIDLERAIISCPIIDYSILSTRLIRKGQKHLAEIVTDYEISELGVVSNRLSRIHRIYYSLTEIFNTVLKDHNHVSSIDLIPDIKKREFENLLVCVKEDMICIGIKKESAEYFIMDLSGYINKKIDEIHLKS